MSRDLWLTLVVSNYVFKVGVEVLMMPLTALVVNKIKRAEGVDVYDLETNFSPFRWKD